MTNLYFIRHCKPDFSELNDRHRPLTLEGLNDRSYIVDFLKDKNIDIIFSSHYKRCVDTITPFADIVRLSINEKENLRERNIGKWVENFNEYALMQWNNFEYKIKNGESLSEVQTRNIAEIKSILYENSDKNIAISTHGTAFSTILNFYDKGFGYSEFEKIKSIMPFVGILRFERDKFLDYKIVDPKDKTLIL
ncbi:MAG: histidine phosphatase family protein [Clostridiales bacterium]|nr:MAG: histidine phosphatase family protein [Clostridiales bacterium]